MDAMKDRHSRQLPRQPHFPLWLHPQECLFVFRIITACVSVAASMVKPGKKEDSGKQSFIVKPLLPHTINFVLTAHKRQ